MKLVARSAIAALAVAAVATPALADEWVYQPDSGYDGSYGNYVPDPDAVPYGPPYAAPDDDDGD